MSSAAPRRSAMGLLKVYFRESAQMRSWTCLQPTGCRNDIPHDMAEIQSLLDILPDIFESVGSFLLRLLCRTQLPHSGSQLLGWDSTVAKKILGNWSQQRARIRPLTPARRLTVSRAAAYCSCMPAVLQPLSNAVTISITL